MKFLTTLCLLTLCQVTLAWQWFGETRVTETRFNKEKSFIREALRAQKQKDCLNCDGTGEVDVEDPSSNVCKPCRGTGKVCNYNPDCFGGNFGPGFCGMGKSGAIYGDIFERKCMIYAEHCPQEIVDQLDEKLLPEEAKAIVESFRFRKMMKCWWMPLVGNLNLSQDETEKEWREIMRPQYLPRKAKTPSSRSSMDRLASEEEKASLSAQEQIVVQKHEVNDKKAVLDLGSMGIFSCWLLDYEANGRIEEMGNKFKFKLQEPEITDTQTREANARAEQKLRSMNASDFRGKITSELAKLNGVGQYFNRLLDGWTEYTVDDGTADDGEIYYVHEDGKKQWERPRQHRGWNFEAAFRMKTFKYSTPKGKQIEYVMTRHTTKPKNFDMKGEMSASRQPQDI